MRRIVLALVAALTLAPTPTPDPSPTGGPGSVVQDLVDRLADLLGVKPDATDAPSAGSSGTPRSDESPAGRSTRTPHGTATPSRSGHRSPSPAATVPDSSILAAPGDAPSAEAPEQATPSSVAYPRLRASDGDTLAAVSLAGLGVLVVGAAGLLWYVRRVRRRQSASGTP